MLHDYAVLYLASFCFVGHLGSQGRGKLLDVHAEAALYARKRLEDALKPVDERLHEWGKWTKNGAPKLGFSEKSSHLQPAQDAIMVPPATFLPQTVVEVDAAIARLTNIRQKVLAIAYMHYPALPADFQRKKLNMSRHKWNSLLRESRIVVGAIIGIAV